MINIRDRRVVDRKKCLNKTLGDRSLPRSCHYLDRTNSWFFFLSSIPNLETDGRYKLAADNVPDRRRCFFFFVDNNKRSSSVD